MLAAEIQKSIDQGIPQLNLNIPNITVDKIPTNLLAAVQKSDMNQAILKAMREQRLKRVEIDFLMKSDLPIIQDVLISHATKLGDRYLLSFQNYSIARKALDDRFRWLCTTSIFAMFPKVKDYFINVATFMSFVKRVMFMLEAQFTLVNYAQHSEEYVTESELSRFLKDIIPIIRCPDEERMNRCYLRHCLRKFSFYLDKTKQGKFNIEKLVASTVMIELLQLRDGGSIYESETNWFSPSVFADYFEQFKKLDLDGNNTLSRKEVTRMRKGELTKTFLDRVFNGLQMYNNEMVFNALDYLDTPEAMSFIYRILDPNGVGYLDYTTVHSFVRDVAIRMMAANLDDIPPSDIMNEIFDLANPTNREHITLNDLKNSGMGGVILNMLVDFTGFHLYDQKTASQG